jgi:hypothetical protein
MAARNSSQAWSMVSANLELRVDLTLAQPATASAMVSRLAAARAMKRTTGVKPSVKYLE